MVDLILEPESQLVKVEDSSPTVSVLWDKAVQEAVINTAPGPTVASRAYSIVHTAMYDAWAAYDPKAISTIVGDDWQQPATEITEANKQEAMSYSAYNVLVALFPSEVAIFNDLMTELGYDITNNTQDPNTPAGIGNKTAETTLELRYGDGANQIEENGIVSYPDFGEYVPINSSANDIVDPNKWTPESVPIDDAEGNLQKFLTPHWGNVTSFAPETKTLLPEVPDPFLLVEGTVDLKSKTITLEDGSTVAIDRSLIGTIINPEFIAQTEQVVQYSANLTDEQKLIAEFWEDGGGTSFPPGTWMTFGQFVSARDDNNLDDDAKMFFALSNAVCDAGIATWKAKTYYDYTRPVRTIRTLGELGLIGEYNDSLGGYAIEAWKPDAGTQTILATDFLTYQTPGSDPSPPFSEYTSGHSGFSAAGAEVLQQFTGSDRFDAKITFEAGSSRFEPGTTPETKVTLAWDTFSAAADEAGISRLYGGIHFEDGDENGRLLGRQAGDAVYDRAQFFINGGAKTSETVFGTLEDDVLEISNAPAIVFAGEGNDLIDGTTSDYISASNRLYGGNGEDILIAGKNDRLLGQNGNDTLFTTQGGNVLTGGSGQDRFWIGNHSRFVKINTITDFELDKDLLGIGDSNTSFTDLTLTQSDRGTVVSTSDRELVLLSDIAATDLNESHFI